MGRRFVVGGNPRRKGLPLGRSNLPDQQWQCAEGWGSKIKHNKFYKQFLVTILEEMIMHVCRDIAYKFCF